MSYISLSAYQVALVALLPKRGTGATAETLAQSSNLPFARVVTELKAMVAAGVLVFDEGTGEYRNAGDRHDG